jgi:hypothetical protein
MPDYEFIDENGHRVLVVRIIVLEKKRRGHDLLVESSSFGPQIWAMFLW